MTLIKKLAKRIVYKMPQRIKKMVYCIYNSVHYPEMKEKKMSFGEKYFMLLDLLLIPQKD